MTHAWQKRKKQAEGTVVEAEAETPAELSLLSSRPAWVVDHNLASLWMKGLSEDMIPEELRLSPTEMAKLERLREWAADKAEETAQAPALPLQALTTPPPPPVAVASRANLISSGAATPFVFDPAALAQAVALKVGPRVGGSPDTVLPL